jgi:hypothetical protein
MVEMVEMVEMGARGMEEADGRGWWTLEGGKQRERGPALTSASLALPSLGGKERAMGPSG